MSKTQAVSRYYNDHLRKLVKNMQEAKELRDEALRQVKRRMFDKFDENYSDWLAFIFNFFMLKLLILNMLF